MSIKLYIAQFMFHSNTDLYSKILLYKSLTAISVCLYNFTLHEVTSNCPLRARSVNVSQVEAAIRIHAPSFMQSVCLIAVYQKYTLPRKCRTPQLYQLQLR
jgi:hypothetical protein